MFGWGSWGYKESWDSEHDSTWEDDEDYKESKYEKKKSKYSRSHRPAEDLQRYRRGYSDMLNLQFYRNKIAFIPDGVHIDDLHQHWKSNYYELESNHNYIQWLFPLREPGMNRSAMPLTEKEIEEMKNDKDVMKRLLESYKLMLGFYGIQLVDSESGEVTWAPNWRERSSNLNTRTHNNLRITRILKCLGEFGYERYQAPLVRFFLEETLCHGNLHNVKESALDYFMFTVKNKSERKELVLFAWEHYKPKEKFIWGPVETLRKLRPPAPPPVENPGDGSEVVQEEHEKSIQKNGRGCISSNHANEKQIKKCNRKGKTKSEKFPSEHASVGKENISQGHKKSNVSKESSEPSTVSDLGNDEENKESPVESGSQIQEFATESEDSDNSGSADKNDKIGTPTECESGAIMHKVEPLIKFRPENDNVNGVQPMQSSAAADTGNKSDDNNENREPPTDSGSADNQENEAQPEAVDDPLPPTYESDDDKNRAPTRASGTEEDVNRLQQMQFGSAVDKDTKATLTESESVDNEEKRGLLMVPTLQDDEENKEPPSSGSKEDKENGQQPTQSGSADGNDNTL